MKKILLIAAILFSINVDAQEVKDKVNTPYSGTWTHITVNVVQSDSTGLATVYYQYYDSVNNVSKSANKTIQVDANKLKDHHKDLLKEAKKP